MDKINIKKKKSLNLAVIFGISSILFMIIKSFIVQDNNSFICLIFIIITLITFILYLIFTFRYYKFDEINERNWYSRHDKHKQDEKRKN